MARDAGPPPEGADRAEGQEEAQDKKPAFPTKLVTMLGVVVMAALAGFVVVHFVLGPRMTIDEGQEQEDSRAEDTQSVFYDMDQMIVNLASEDFNEYLVTKITLKVAGQTVLDEKVLPRMAVIQSALNGLLSTKKYADTQGVVAQEQLGREIRDKINGELGLTSQNGVTDVYFRELMVQAM